MHEQNNPIKGIKESKLKSIKLFFNAKKHKLLQILFNAVSRVKKNNHWINRSNIIISSLTLILIIIVTVSYLQSTNQNAATATKETKTVNKSGVLTKGTPTYKTLLPAGKTIVQLGGWTRVSPSNVDPVYAFVDKIGEIPINLSQQPLPSELKDDTDNQLSLLASDFRAEEKLMVGNTTVYIGTSAKGPQSVIFTKDNLLILIKSSVKISNEKWTSYINSLQ